jgi:hypothetical protein
VGNLGSCLVIADFNGGNKLDVVVGSVFAAVNVFLGNGDGTLQSPLNIS